MSEGEVRLDLRGPVARITFFRPEARNAMTKAMYRQLHAICGRLAESEGVRVAILRGAGGEAFVAGSDIGIFESFTGGEDGIAYEAEMETYTRALADLPMPTIAVIEGWAVGGGLNLAAVCDIRVGTPDCRLGVPIAKTVGNCLSIHNYARLVSGFGVSRAKRMLMLAAFIDAEEALQCGFLAEIVERERLDARVEELAQRVLALAPVTLKVSKRAINRLQRMGLDAEAEELIREAYSSEDFRIGIAAFRDKAVPGWTGR